MVGTENNRYRAIYFSLPEEYHLAFLVGRKNNRYSAIYFSLPFALHPSHFGISFSYYSFLFFYRREISIPNPCQMGLAA
ncbi:MAG TPA: hypothetical protein VFF80_01250 [Bacillota bacterium]|nr:hypothetical protein [Bacillota bacterium]